MSDKPRILFVDDEMEFAKMMAKVLSLRGFEVETAYTGTSALETFNSGKYDLVVTDLSMPGMDGIELIRQLRKQNPSQRIIVATGFPSQITQRQAFKLGTLHYIVKPFSIERFIEFVTTALEEEPEDGFLGQIRMKCEDLIQMYALAAKNIILEILCASSGEIGRIFIEKGRVVHAETPRKEGEEAFYEIQLWDSGIFRTSPLEGEFHRTIDRSPDALILEGARLRDEAPNNASSAKKKE